MMYKSEKSSAEAIKPWELKLKGTPDLCPHQASKDSTLFTISFNNMGAMTLSV